MQISPELGINEVLGTYICKKQPFGAFSPSSIVFIKVISEHLRGLEQEEKIESEEEKPNNEK